MDRPLWKSVLVCDSDRDDGLRLAAELRELDYEARAVASYAEAFACACTFDLDALVVTQSLYDGPALILPIALGIRRPPIVVLASHMQDRLSTSAVKRAGFDAQLTKVVDATEIDHILGGTSYGRRARRERARRPRTGRAHVSLVAWTSDRS